MTRMELFESLNEFVAKETDGLVLNLVNLDLTAMKLQVALIIKTRDYHLQNISNNPNYLPIVLSFLFVEFLCPTVNVSNCLFLC